MAQIELGHHEDDFENRQKEVLKIYNRLHRANQHKMQPIPVCEVAAELKN
jgi:NAD+ synthase